MNNYLLLLSFLVLAGFVQTANAQTIINVTETTPCFLNETAGVWVWRDCGVKDDYLTAMLLPWQWITGGYFSMILVAIFVLFSYIKYQRAIYPIIVGSLFLPISYYLFPEIFISYAILFATAAIGLMVIFMLMKQTKEY